EWVHVQLHQQKGMISLSPPTICNSARETDFDLGYTIQSGWLKNLGLRARYAIYDNNMLSTANIKPVNETRINIDYTWKFK
ncbi:OprD family porin, partial [Acinetobacter baumannii]|nr:OprD family porin [Acinetobacter baumannii]MCF4347349.1 OprD family porin [Acinetobacter baumannii]MCF4351271.1 OprD family porin [Acinetobacter baumannii]MCF4354367.1 OprD family porin [Acinetobacter baumannii]MCF4358375.1 OprD family porin [Acinetobacter baumannii]